MGNNKKHFQLFNRIASIYGLYYRMQKKRYKKVLNQVRDVIDISQYENIIDIGCGTGAMCEALYQEALTVTGLDPASKMLRVARKRTSDDITYINRDVLDQTWIEEDLYDIAFASYVAHGLKKDDRLTMIKHMSVMAESYVILHDYNKNRNALTSFVEWAEGGDYSYFIDHVLNELRDCKVADKHCFESIEVIDVGKRASWYICKIKK